MGSGTVAVVVAVVVVVVMEEALVRDVSEKTRIQRIFMLFLEWNELQRTRRLRRAITLLRRYTQSLPRLSSTLLKLLEHACEADASVCVCVCVCVCVYVHVQRLHPDKSDSEEDAAQFRRIQRAYDVLKDKEQRRLYDGLGHEQFERYESIVLSGRGCVDVYASLKSACVCVEMERDRVMDVVDVWMDVGDNSKDENR